MTYESLFLECATFIFSHLVGLVAIHTALAAGFAILSRRYPIRKGERRPSRYVSTLGKSAKGAT